MKNRIYAIVLFAAFFSVMVGMSYATGNKGVSSDGKGGPVITETLNSEQDIVCEPLGQGFWKRICDGATGNKKFHKSTPEGFNPDLTLRAPQTLCEALQFEDKNDPCAQAKSQEAALAFNIEYGFLSESCPIFRLDGSQTTVGVAADEIFNMINEGDCTEAESYAEGINSEYLFEDPYYQANLFNIEQNTFYKDIYVKVSNWLKDFLSI